MLRVSKNTKESESIVKGFRKSFRWVGNLKTVLKGGYVG